MVPVPAPSPDAIETFVRTATGPLGLFAVFLYSFLVAFVLPFPSELVLAAPLDLGLPYTVTLGVIVLVASAGKAVGSLVALRVGQGASDSLLDARVASRVPAPPGRLTGFINEYGYVGLALTLSVPLMPDTVSVYAFSVLESDRRKFAAAAFVGSVVRFVVTLVVVAGVVSLL